MIDYLLYVDETKPSPISVLRESLLKGSIMKRP